MKKYTHLYKKAALLKIIKGGLPSLKSLLADILPGNLGFKFLPKNFLRGTDIKPTELSYKKLVDIMRKQVERVPGKKFINKLTLQSENIPEARNSITFPLQEAVFGIPVPKTYAGSLVNWSKDGGILLMAHLLGHAFDPGLKKYHLWGQNHPALAQLKAGLKIIDKPRLDLEVKATARALHALRQTGLYTPLQLKAMKQSLKYCLDTYRWNTPVPKTIRLGTVGAGSYYTGKKINLLIRSKINNKNTQ